MAATVVPILLLQRPSRSSKNKAHVLCLERRIPIWQAGNLAELLLEGRAIQSRLSKQKSRSKPRERSARTFASKMFQGKTKEAMEILSDKQKGGVLGLDDLVSTGVDGDRTVRDILKDKHPPGQSADPRSLETGGAQPFHPAIFDSIDAQLIRSVALKISGAAGPSGLDAYGWRRLCTCFGSASGDLCQALAELARRLCTQLVDPSLVAPFLACRLIALDKQPGVRPIGIGDTARRIIAKAILVTIRGDIQDAAGSLQLCAGQISGVEAAIHAIRTAFESGDCEALLLVDASNAFNSLNRQTALRNICVLCPALSTVLINSYRGDSDLFVGGDVLSSCEGTTQGDPLAMPMYAVATIPLIKKLTSQVYQVWYADDAAAAGKIEQVRQWWDEIVEYGPGFGYFANAAKTWLITKENCLQTAIDAFAGTNVQVTTTGRPYLGAPIGSRAYVESFVQDKVLQWCKELQLLSSFAESQPHAAHSAFTHGLTSKWTHLLRTTPAIGQLLQPLEDAIREKLIPELTGRPPPNDNVRSLLALPARFGGIALTNPTAHSDSTYSASYKICEPLKDAILSRAFDYPYEVIAGQMTARSEVRQQLRSQSTQCAEDVEQMLPNSLRKAVELASEKGASSWLTTKPIEEFGFALHKGAFRDALALRYDWPLSRIPDKCDCGSQFSIEHALSCAKGGFPILRHNEIRDITAGLLTEVCHDVRVEPDLQPLSGESLRGASSNTQDGARLDVAMSGFWGGRHERTFCDVRIFNPHAPSNRNTNLASCYRKHERLKKKCYDQRVIEIEHATFTPLVFSATGGMANESKTFFKRLATLLSRKWNDHYSSTLSWLRCRLIFSLIRSSIRCIRGARSHCGHAVKSAPVDLVRAETGLQSEA